MGEAGLNLDKLVETIREINDTLSARASRAVNAALTMRNWLIGFYVQEYEQRGLDRADYGEKVLDSISLRLRSVGVSRCEARELRRYRRFYQVYPQIRETLSPELRVRFLPLEYTPNGVIRESLTPGLRLGVTSTKSSSNGVIGESVTPQLPPKGECEASDPGMDAERHGLVTSREGHDLVSRLSFTHITELLKCEESDKRAFYERECIAGSWSVRELRRQINSFYYERSRLSVDKQKARNLANSSAQKAQTYLEIRDPYVFEFLGLKPKEVMGESHLEDQLLDRLQEFLIELGRGFCFEARQRRILIGDSYGFVDLVFYQRILKCHVLVDLKLEEFNHENIGQLNTYVSWYRENVMADDDNPPVGILLCASKDRALVEYALAGMDNQLFVSKYQLELPDEETLCRELQLERQRIEAENGG